MLDRALFASFIRTLAVERELYGSVVDAGAIRFRRIETIDDFARGYSDAQRPGSYRLTHDAESDRLFDHSVGPDSLKGFLHPPEIVLFEAFRDDAGIRFVATSPDARPKAVIGARACDLAAADILGEVFERAGDQAFGARRSELFVVAVDCARPAPTCFCTTVGGGPRAETGFDVALTEIDTSDGPAYVARTGTNRGTELLTRLDAPEATDAHVTTAGRIVERSTRAMMIRFDRDAVRRALLETVAAPARERVGDRCLACGNCTQVCPTCFCTTTTDHTSLDGSLWERHRVWDSCFSLDFSALHRTPVRTSIAARYRQWINHKLSTWYDQFGSSGCVGCGRCITWCPVGIDLVAEALEAEEALT